MNVKYTRTKIVATIGPSSSPKEVLLKMIQEGLDVCRINFSHGSHEQHRKVIETIRQINEKHATHIGILADLQGPKIRIGQVKKGGVLLKKGNIITLTTRHIEEETNIFHITYEHFPKDVKKNETILMDDGKLRLKVVGTDGKEEVQLKVIHGGLLTSNKGVNMPNTKVSAPSLTKKDREDLEFALEQGVEWIGLSFVREAKDITELKAIIKEHKSTARVIAKIEKPEAIKNLDGIIAATDAVMVARGDLGVETPLEKVPAVQKIIVKKCLDAVKPVIIATQMMESMISSPSPTRAEVNDVANSVLDGADAVMLSGETSVGDYPVECIKVMQNIIQSIEDTSYPYSLPNPPKPGKRPSFFSEAILYNACMLAEQTGAKGIVSMTNSGFSAFQLSNHRPKAITFIFTNNRSILKTLSLLWGVRTYYYDKLETTDKTIEEVNKMLLDEGAVKKGDILINTASIPIQMKGRTNMLKVGIVQ